MTQTTGGRKLKKHLEALLLEEPFDPDMAGLRDIPPRKSVNLLISFFCSLNTLLKWRAVSATGAVIERLCQDCPEEARIIMRRLMWMLNEESGGIGWGAAEAMGETMARSPLLAGEYNRILISYIDDSGNLLEHEPLQTGVLWGIHRLARIMPERMETAKAPCRPYLQSGDPEKRGLACLIAGHLHDTESTKSLIELTRDTNICPLYDKGYISRRPVAELAKTALYSIE